MDIYCFRRKYRSRSCLFLGQCREGERNHGNHGSKNLHQRKTEVDNHWERNTCFSPGQTPPKTQGRAWLSLEMWGRRVGTLRRSRPPGAPGLPPESLLWLRGVWVECGPCAPEPVGCPLGGSGPSCPGHPSEARLSRVPAHRAVRAGTSASAAGLSGAGARCSHRVSHTARPQDAWSVAPHLRVDGRGPYEVMEGTSAHGAPQQLEAP